MSIGVEHDKYSANLNVIQFRFFREALLGMLLMPRADSTVICETITWYVHNENSRKTIVLYHLDGIPQLGKVCARFLQIA